MYHHVSLINIYCLHVYFVSVYGKMSDEHETTRLALIDYITLLKRERCEKKIKGKIHCPFCQSTHSRFGTLKQHMLKKHAALLADGDAALLADGVPSLPQDF